MNRARVGRLYDKLAAAMPEPTSELKFGTPFELLLAVIANEPLTRYFRIRRID